MTRAGRHMCVISMIKTMILGVSAAVLISFGTAAAAPVFLEGLEYGAAKESVASRPGALKGEEAFQNEVFFKSMPWAGFAWSAQCSFKDGKLAGVALYSAYSRELLDHVTSFLKAQRFQMLGMIVDDKALDMVSLVKLGGIEAFQKRYRELVSARVPEKISYNWFDSRKINDDQMSVSASLSQLLALVDREILQVDVVQSASGEKLENPMLSVHFSFPVLDEAGSK